MRSGDPMRGSALAVVWRVFKRMLGRELPVTWQFLRASGANKRRGGPPRGAVDSISKCNRIRNCRPVLHEVECAFWQEQFGGRFPAQRFPGPGVEQPRDVVQLLLGKDRQIGSLGQILAEQSVGVFV